MRIFTRIKNLPMQDLLSADGWLNRMVTATNDFLWTYILIAVLIGCAL